MKRQRLFLLQAPTTLVKHEWSGSSFMGPTCPSDIGSSRSEGLDKAASIASMALNADASISGVSRLTALTGPTSEKEGELKVKAQSRAIQPPISLEGTERVCKVRRCKTWMMRHNIEGELRWMRDELATFELRRAPCEEEEVKGRKEEMREAEVQGPGEDRSRRRGRPFLVLYEERSSPWDDGENPATMTVWLLPETQLERTGPSRLFIHNRYCVEFPTRKEATACLRLLDAERARLASMGPANIIAITGTLLSIGRVHAYIRGPKGNWEELGVCQAEFQSTTTQCAAFSLAMAGSSRTCFQAWVHPETSTKRIDPRNLIAVLPAPDSSARSILLRSKEPQESMALEELFVAAKRDSIFKASDSFISCYGPGQEHEEGMFDGIAKVYSKEGGHVRLVGLGRLYVHLIRSDRARRMFLVSSELHEEVLQVRLPPQFSNVSRSSLTITVTAPREEGGEAVVYEIKVRSEREARRLEGALLALPTINEDDPVPICPQENGGCEEMLKRMNSLEEEDGMMKKIQEDELLREEHGIVEQEMCAQMEVNMAVALEQISQLSLGPRRSVGHLEAVPEEEEEEEECWNNERGSNQKVSLHGGLKRRSFSSESIIGKRGAPREEESKEAEGMEKKEEEEAPYQAPRTLRHKRSRTGEDGSIGSMKPSPRESPESGDSLSKSMIDLKRRMSQENLFGITLPGERGWRGGAVEKEECRASSSADPSSSRYTEIKHECRPQELLKLFGLESTEDWIQAGATARETRFLLDPRARTRVTMDSLMQFIRTHSTN